MYRIMFFLTLPLYTALSIFYTFCISLYLFDSKQDKLPFEDQRWWTEQSEINNASFVGYIVTT